MPPVIFWFFATLSIVAALGVVVQRNPVHSLLALVLTLISIAVLFIGQDAVVVGLLQIIVYAGAIMVLFLFVIWLLNLPVETESSGGRLAIKFLGTIAVVALLAELESFSMPGWLQIKSTATTHPAGYGSIEALSETLFSQYLIAFEVTSVLLLVAVVGAVAMARRSTPDEVRERAEQLAGREKAA
jgi:NADH-quinone oxidoreductase subunit J